MDYPVDAAGDEVLMAPPFLSGPTLFSGARIPSIGLGVYRCASGDETYSAVLTALRGGYRHFDTAQMYSNESDVGHALRDSKVPRSEVFLTTKLRLEAWGYQNAMAAVKCSLENMQVSYVDLLLLHAPGDPGRRSETWRALEDCRNQGLARDIGVSNFGEAHLDRLAQTATIQPAVNQIEVHPWGQRKDLVALCMKRGIVVEAYSPLAKASKLNDPVVSAIATHYGITPAQVLLAWSLSKGMVALPKSVRPVKQRENLAAAKVRLTAADIASLDGLEKGLVTGWDPVNNAPV